MVYHLIVAGVGLAAKENTMKFQARSNYRCLLPDGKFRDYCVTRRTGGYVFLHDGVTREFRKPTFVVRGLEVCYPFGYEGEGSVVLSSGNIVERKVK